MLSAKQSFIDFRGRFDHQNASSNWVYRVQGALRAEFPIQRRRCSCPDFGSILPPWVFCCPGGSIWFCSCPTRARFVSKKSHFTYSLVVVSSNFFGHLPALKKRCNCSHFWHPLASSSIPSPFFIGCLGACRRRTPRAGTDQRAATESSRCL